MWSLDTTVLRSARSLIFLGGRYETDKATYHVSATLADAPETADAANAKPSATQSVSLVFESPRKQFAFESSQEEPND